MLCVVLGPFLLTNLLLDNLKATAEETGEEGRIVNISSDAHKWATVDGRGFEMVAAIWSFEHSCALCETNCS